MPPVKPTLRTIHYHFIPKAPESYVHIPLQTLFFTPNKLSASQRVFYMVLLEHEQTAGHFPTNKELAEQTGISTRTVARWLTYMQSIGYVVEEAQQ